MLAVLEFVFSSFWIWLGTVVLILAVGDAFTAILGTMRKRTCSKP